MNYDQNKREDRSTVTVIGLGEMGQALASAFLRNGYRTTVWNRTAAKADFLVKQGAVLASTPAEAVQASPVVIIYGRSANHRNRGRLHPLQRRRQEFFRFQQETARGHGCRQLRWRRCRIGLSA